MISAHLFCESYSTLALANANPSELAAFHAACLPAHFGHGSERVYDENYRLAREILPERFKLNFDPIENSNGILSNIATVCRIRTYSISTQLYKVNSYGPGGFFRAHKDTPREAHHIGTLVIALPTAFEGGEFTLRHESTEHVLDWSINGRGEYVNELHWIFFYSDVEHEINPVKNGYRITISYNIYGNRKLYHDVRSTEWEDWDQYANEDTDEYNEDDVGKITDSPPVYQDPEHERYKAALKEVDITWKLSPIFGGLINAFHNKSFLPNGGYLAFGLDHEYGFSGHRRPIKRFDWFLKGRDAAMFAAVKALGFPYELKAVYKLEDNWDEILDRPRPRIDDFSSSHGRGTQHLVTWDDFSGLSTNHNEFYATSLLILLCRAAPDVLEGESVIGEFLRLGANVDFTLVWAHYPTTINQACKYIKYGNEPTMYAIYVAAALIINIPRFGTHGRIGTFY